MGVVCRREDWYSVDGSYLWPAQLSSRLKTTLLLRVVTFFVFDGVDCLIVWWTTPTTSVRRTTSTSTWPCDLTYDIAIVLRCLSCACEDKKCPTVARGAIEQVSRYRLLLSTSLSICASVKGETACIAIVGAYPFRDLSDQLVYS